MNPLDGEADYYTDANNKKKTKNYYCPSSDMVPGFSADTSKDLLNVPCDLGQDATCALQTTARPDRVVATEATEKRSGSGQE